MIYQRYQENIQQAKQDIQVIHKAINQNSFLRLSLILGGSGILFYLAQQENLLLLLLVALFVVLGFAFLLRRQGRLDKRYADAHAFLRINENEITLRDTRQNIYDEGADFENGEHPYSSDLDIFGAFSLFALLNRCATGLGLRKLASWLLQADDKKTIEDRQDAVAEIAKDLDWSQALQTCLLVHSRQKLEVKTFLLRYFEEVGLRFGNAFMRLYVPVAPFLILGLLLLSIFVLRLWIPLLLLGFAHLLWTLAAAGNVSQFSNRIDRVGQVLAAYADGFALLEEKDFVTVENQRLQQQLCTGDKHLSVAFKNLSKLINNLDARNNMLVGALLNMIFLWDFKFVMKILRWKASYGKDIVHAFDVLAEFEALNALAVWKRNHPNWARPVFFADTADSIRAEEISHPLIAVSQAVNNTYTDKGYQIALITGSNMAGKSTFLRTLGINAVLAYAGAVVCARHFQLPIFHLISYMRIKDSLNESISTFKAELDRMKFILDTVEQDGDCFFLIDEMLRGTNSVDKYLGSRAIIRKLINLKGKGMVATHDLQLASLEEEYHGKIRNYHFDIRVQNGVMLFDYKLKEGRCTIFNASLLLEGIGIKVDSKDVI